MSKYLKKLKEGTSARGNKYINSNYNCHGVSLYCGNGYKEGLKHFFSSNDESDITLLIDIIRRFRFGTIITNITKNSFEFESKTENEQIFFFRICRYVRCSNIKKVLKDTVMINKSGVKIQNAFLLAHYYNYKSGYCMNISYYNMGFDPFYDASSGNSLKLNKPYKLLKDFKSSFDKTIKDNYNNSQSFMSLFKWSEKTFNVEKPILFKLLKNDDFKAAEKYLLHVWE
jgi:hypothetical protein